MNTPSFLMASLMTCAVSFFSPFFSIVYASDTYADDLVVTHISSASGVDAYQVTLDEGEGAYILRVFLSSGATIRSSQTVTVRDSKTSPGYMLRPLSRSSESQAEISVSMRSRLDGQGDTPWGVASHQELLQDRYGSTPFALFNGQFFGRYYSLSSGYTARLAFGLSSDGMIDSLGYGRSESYRKRILMVDDGVARVVPYTLSSLYSLKEKPQSLAIVGLHPFANKDAHSTKKLARTYLGVAGETIDGGGDTLVIVISSALSERQAYKILRKMGARETVMLDGGGSTQLSLDGTSYIASSRPVPHALAVYPAQ